MVSHLIFGGLPVKSFLGPLGLKNPLAREFVRIAARDSGRSHRLRVFTSLDDAVYDPYLKGVIKTVPDTAIPDLVRAEPGHQHSL
jgi:hypothetical protein